LGTMLAALGTFVGRVSVREAWALLRREWMLVGLLATAAVAYAPAILGYGPWLDRHLLFSVALMLTVVAAVGARLTTKPLGVPALILASVLAVMSVTLLHDSFAWRRAVAATIADLREHGVAPADIDSGFEYSNIVAQPADPSLPMPLAVRA